VVKLSRRHIAAGAAMSGEIADVDHGCGTALMVVLVDIGPPLLLVAANKHSEK